MSLPVCVKPLTKGPNKGQTATGTLAGFKRHRYWGEEPCEPCREAERIRLRKYNWDDRRQEYALRWQRANRDKVAEYNRRWRKAHPEYKRHWRKKHPDKGKQYYQRAFERDPERLRERNRRRHAYERQALTLDFTSEQLDQRMSMFGYRCWMCGADFEHVDHVKPISKGGAHVLANLRPACESCNKAKGARWPLGEVV